MPGLTPHHPPTTAGSTPIKREPEEVEGARTFPATLPRPWARKRNQAGPGATPFPDVTARIRPSDSLVGFDIINVEMGPTIDLRQEFELSPTLLVSLLFDQMGYPLSSSAVNM